MANFVCPKCDRQLGLEQCKRVLLLFYCPDCNVAVALSPVEQVDESQVKYDKMCRVAGIQRGRKRDAQAEVSQLKETIDKIREIIFKDTTANTKEQVLSEILELI